MRICDLKEEEIKIGMKIKSLCDDRIGTIVKMDNVRYPYYWILWDDETEVYSGFYENDCECEVVE